MSSSTSLAIALVLLLGNAFFVGAEFAVISSRRSQIEPLVDAGRRGARTTLWSIENVSLMLAAAQLGITICSLGLGAVAEPAIAHLLYAPFEALGMPEGLVHPVAFAIALSLVVYLHVVVGEMIPKNLALAGPERAALVLAPPLVLFARLVAPLLTVLRGVTNVILRLMRVEPKEELTSAFTAEEVHAIVTESQREGLIDPGYEVLTGALELSSRRAGDVMVPWDDLVVAEAGATPHEVERLVARTGYSRYPVLSGPRVVGYIHVKDLLDADDQRSAEPIRADEVRPLARVAEDDDIEDVLAVLQRSGSHLANVMRVVPTGVPDGADTAAEPLPGADVPGAQGQPAMASEELVTVGVVFLEDVLEELVGEVRDATQRSSALLAAARARRNEQ